MQRKEVLYNKLKMEYSVARTSHRWPLTIFFTLLNIAGINGQIIYKSNTNVTMPRQKCLKIIARDLVLPFVQQRLHCDTLSIELKILMTNFVQVTSGRTKVENTHETGKCFYCPKHKNRKTKVPCNKCHKLICWEHKISICIVCNLKEDEIAKGEMCSVNDRRFDDDDDEIIKNKGKDSLADATLCRKCKCENADVLLIGQSGYCKSCFLIVTNHKFRAALGKSKIIRHGDSILVDHSGELNSTVLLHLVKAGMSESAHKRLIFKTVVLYIDDSTAERTSEERDMLRHRIAEETKASGFDGYAVSMSQVLNEEDTLDIKPMDEEINYENDNRLRAILASLSDDTSRTDLADQLRRRLLLSAARKLHCNKIFVADSAVDIAAKVLGDVCLGRGAQLSTQANFCDARCADIKILKPMRDFAQQELVYYSEHHEINSVKSTEPSAPATTVQGLARNFTTGLESQFSGTISTVFRTADKISPKSNVQQSIEDNCALCEARLDFMPSGNEVTAMRAIEVSKFMSSKSVNASSPSNRENGESNCLVSRSDNEECCNDGGECGCKNDIKRQVTAEDVWSYLCYSCRRIFRSSEILRTLPAPLLFAVQQRIALKSMREKISDFLL